MKSFALFYGVVFLLVGIAGSIPGMTSPHDHPDVVVGTGLGLLFGLFPVNVIHNIIHAAFGAWGILASRDRGWSRTYAKSVAIIYALLTVFGLIAAGRIYTTFGLAPLYGHDVWLHAALAAGAAYFAFAHRDDRVATHA
ncbi:MAG TPA: DUF4383 domain-containing protein [Burkholderiaceae bacterium]|nr:DUF4383 domain-containing protein [Burkholderiaceae bacterium]